MPYLSVAQQRHVEDIGIGQVDAEKLAGLRFHNRPGGHAADFGAKRPVGVDHVVGDEPAGGVRMTVRIDGVFAQENLVRRMRRIGLVLIDEWRRGVLGVAVCALTVARLTTMNSLALLAGRRGVAKDAVGAGDQRIIRLQRDENDLGAVLGDEVKAVIEELAEECHPRIERRRQADIRCRVRDEEDLSVVLGAEDAVETGTRNR